MKTAGNGSSSVAALDAGTDPLGEFGSESREASRAAADAAPAIRLKARPGTWLVLGLSLAVLAQLPIVVLWVMGQPLRFVGTTGTVHVESTPPGAEIRMDGKSLGRTPLALSLEAGDRLLDVQYEGVARPVPVTIHAGEVVRQRIEFVGAATAAAAPSTRGSISIATEPARAAVFVDGTARGTSPLVVSDLEPGDHPVTVRFATGAVERTIRVEAGATASLVATAPPAAGALSGWIAMDVPQSLQIFEQGRLVGTTDISRLMLPAGEHVLEFVNDELGFRARRTVRVNPGATTQVPVDLPRAPLAINAQPWANVWVDGEAVGETPIGNLSPTIGRHEVVFRHPQLGERRQTVLVTLKAPARVGVDLRRPQ